MNKTVLQIVLWVAVGALATWLVLAAPSTLQQRAKPVVRSHSIPDSLQSWWVDALRESLQGYGNMSKVVDGRVLITAPESIQEEIPGLIEEMSKLTPKEPATIRVEAWIVTGLGAQDEIPAGDEHLGELRQVLSEVARAGGPQSFAILNKTTFQVRAGGEGSAGSVAVKPAIKERNGSEVIGGTVTMPKCGSVSAQFELRPGEIIVLGSLEETMPNPFGKKLSYSMHNQTYCLFRVSR